MSQENQYANAQELRSKFGGTSIWDGEDPLYTRSQWRQDAYENDTCLGYWETAWSRRETGTAFNKNTDNEADNNKPESWFIAKYNCPKCEHQWEQEADSLHDDTCPNCETRDIEADPHVSKEIPVPENWKSFQ